MTPKIQYILCRVSKNTINDQDTISLETNKKNSGYYGRSDYGTFETREAAIAAAYKENQYAYWTIIEEISFG